MGLLSLFKGKIDVGRVVDKLADGADTLRFSNEERAEFNLKMADRLAEYAKDTLSENTIRSKARRHIALIVVYTFIVLLIAAIVLHFVDPEKSKFLIEIISGSPISTGFIMVLAFFFGGYYLKNVSFVNKKERK